MGTKVTMRFVKIDYCDYWGVEEFHEEVGCLDFCIGGRECELLSHGRQIGRGGSDQASSSFAAFVLSIHSFSGKRESVC